MLRTYFASLVGNRFGFPLIVVVALKNCGQPDAAIAVVESGPGESRMDAIRASF